MKAKVQNILEKAPSISNLPSTKRNVERKIDKKEVVNELLYKQESVQRVKKNIKGYVYLFLWISFSHPDPCF